MSVVDSAEKPLGIVKTPRVFDNASGILPLIHRGWKPQPLSARALAGPARPSRCSVSSKPERSPASSAAVVWACHAAGENKG
jgi:hypothetical protein